MKRLLDWLDFIVFIIPMAFMLGIWAEIWMNVHHFTKEQRTEFLRIIGSIGDSLRHG